MSTDAQEASVPEQKEWAARAAAANALAVAAEFQDDGISGSEVERRPGLMALLAWCESPPDGRPVDVILCWNADRLSRADSIRTGAVLARLLDAGVCRLLTAEGWTDFTDETDRILFNLNQDMAKAKFLKDLSRNVARSGLSRARAGLWVAGKPPLGYRIGPDGRLVFGPSAEVDLIRWLFHRFITTDVSAGDLARELEARSDVPPRRSGHWRRDTVCRLLANRAYVGDLVWNATHQGRFSKVAGGEVRKVSGQKGRASLRNADADLVVVADAHPALIDRDTFAAALAKLAASRPGWMTDAVDATAAAPASWRRRCAPPARRNEWVLSGLLCCGDCQGPMTGRVEGHRRGTKCYVYRRYFCSKAKSHGKGACRASSVLEGRVVRALAGMVQDVVARPDHLAALQAELESDGGRRAEEAAAVLRGQDARLSKLDADIARGNANLALLPPDLLPGVIARVRAWQEERQRLAHEREGLLQQCRAREVDARRVAAAFAALRSLGELIDRAPKAAQREALAALVTKVTVHFDHTRAGNQSHASEVTVEWVFGSSEVSPLG
jgi:DNA invertase Pin-like site-specific DNA recombinase